MIDSDWSEYIYILMKYLRPAEQKPREEYIFVHNPVNFSVKTGDSLLDDFKVYKTTLWVQNCTTLHPGCSLTDTLFRVSFLN